MANESAPENKPAGAPENKPATPPEKKETPAPPPAAGEQKGHNRKPLDFPKAAGLLKTTIGKLSDDAASIRGKQSAEWKKIEEMGINKKAAKDVRGLLTQSPATVSDYLRSFIGLLESLGLGIIRDMVDTAEGVTGITVPLIDTPSVDV